MKKILYILNRNYFITSHLAERLEELSAFPAFKSLNPMIKTANEFLNLQIHHTDQLFELLTSIPVIEVCEPVINFLESSFPNPKDEVQETHYLALLDYITLAEVIMNQGSSLVQLMKSKFPNIDGEAFHLYDPNWLMPLTETLRGNLLYGDNTN